MAFSIWNWEIVGLLYNKCQNKIFLHINADALLRPTCPGTVGIGDQKYDELKWESSIISGFDINNNELQTAIASFIAIRK